VGPNEYNILMHYVYILRLNDESLYTGRSDDLKRRIAEHRLGKVKSTKHKRPIALIYYEAYIEKSDAIARELYLKTGDGRQEVRKHLKFTLTNAGLV
jgi:putative endonuclease